MLSMLYLKCLGYLMICLGIYITCNGVVIDYNFPTIICESTQVAVYDFERNKSHMHPEHDSDTHTHTKKVEKQFDVGARRIER